MYSRNNLIHCGSMHCTMSNTYLEFSKQSNRCGTYIISCARVFRHESGSASVCCCCCFCCVVLEILYGTTYADHRQKFKWRRIVIQHRWLCVIGSHSCSQSTVTSFSIHAKVAKERVSRSSTFKQTHDEMLVSARAKSRPVKAETLIFIKWSTAIIIYRSKVM